MKAKSISFLLIYMIIFSGCSSQTKTDYVQVKQIDLTDESTCFVPDAPKVKFPLWVCNKEIKETFGDDKFYAVGEFHTPNSTINRQHSFLIAQEELVSSLGSNLDSTIKAIVVGIDSKSTGSNNVFNSQQIQTSKNTLINGLSSALGITYKESGNKNNNNGAKDNQGTSVGTTDITRTLNNIDTDKFTFEREAYVTSPTGKVYTLVSMKVNQFDSVIDSAVNNNQDILSAAEFLDIDLEILKQRVKGLMQ